MGTSRKLIALSKKVGEIRKVSRDAVAGVLEVNKKITAVAKDVANLFHNDNTILNAHDGLADRYYGLVELLRKHEPLAGLLTDENIVLEAQAHRERRLEKERLAKEESDKLAKEQEDKDEVQNLLNADKSSAEESGRDDGVPDGATVFGGG